MAGLPAPTPEADLSVAPTDSSSQDASLSSTPLTTAADSISVVSEPPKSEAESVIEDAIVALALPVEYDMSESSELSDLAQIGRQLSVDRRASPTPSRSRSRPRRSLADPPVYNTSKSAGTAHGKRPGKGEAASRRHTISGATDANPPARATRSSSAAGRGSLSPGKKGKAGAPPAPARRIVTRHSGGAAQTLTTKLSSLGKRGRKTFEKSIARMSRELRRLQDTNEFAKIDEKPIAYTVWANGKYVNPGQADEETERRPRKKIKTEENTPDPSATEGEEASDIKHPRVKAWLSKGLYAGQESMVDATKALSAAEKRKLAQVPELATPAPPNKVLPFPIFNGLRLLMGGRDFQLPFDICSPIPEAKPKGWKKITRSENGRLSALCVLRCLNMTDAV